MPLMKKEENGQKSTSTELYLNMSHMDVSKKIKELQCKTAFSAIMDPWRSCEETEVLHIELSPKSKDFFSFEDNFRPLVSDTLPDSKEYLAVLENKLKKLKSDPNVLQQLTEKREACMRQLLSGISSCMTEDDTLENPVPNSTILRTFAPEKQALTQGERVELVKYDQLIDEDVEIDQKEHSHEQRDK